MGARTISAVLPHIKKLASLLCVSTFLALSCAMWFIRDCSSGCCARIAGPLPPDGAPER
tara:strand:- start:554 stop:730 length:177 start_codon:yes stop_codon:yes gene_type:complete